MSARRDAERALQAATTWAAWRSAAEALDEATGAAAWRADDECEWFDAVLLRADALELRRLREARDGLGLAQALTASVYRHQPDLAVPELYEVALAGTKHVVTRWQEEAEASMRWLATHPVRGLSKAEKRRRFEEAWRVYGHSALLLSGGATWGFHHLGVVKALFEHGVLPHILSGASTGAMIAAGMCSRTDAELAALFADTDQMRLDGLRWVGSAAALRDGACLDPEQLHAVLRHNIGDVTFAEAFAHSGRACAISVSPTRTRQKPRLLSHVTSPDVLMARAALASSALPGLFPPVRLEARGADGRVVPYVPTERWADGSIYGDLPKLRLARLFNVNHFLVSQTNPHVAPVLGLAGQRGAAARVASATASTARFQGAWATDLLRRAAPAWSGPVHRMAERANALVSQDYRGDIDVHPRFRPALLTRMVVNPSREDLATFIREGERATWPRLPRIVDQTRLARVFRECVALLTEEPGRPERDGVVASRGEGGG